MVNTPFVRIGAVAACESCRHRYLIDATHIKRLPSPARVAAGGGSDGPTTADRPQAGGIRGLSEMMQREAARERDSQFNDYDTIAPTSDRPRPGAAASPGPPQPAAPPPTPAPSVAKQPTPTRHQKAIRSWHLLAAAGALALAILGIGIWSINWDGLGTGSSATAEQQAETEQVYDGPMFQARPLVESVMLGYSPWEQPNRPFQSLPQENPDIYVADDDLIPAGAGVIEYVGRVVSERTGVVLSGELIVSLVSPQGTERARTTVPIALVSQDQSMLVHVPIPANLDPTMLHPAWSITLGRVAESDQFIQDVTIDTQSVGADAMALITLGNDTGGPIDRVTLVITAWGDQAQPLRRWRVEWPMRLQPGQYIEFFTRTPVTPTWDIREWTAVAAAS